MHECVMLALWDTFATDIVYCHGKVNKVVNIKYVFLECKNIRLH